MKFRWETEFKETEIGEIPKEWEVKRLNEILTFVRGVSYKSSEINQEEIGELFITLNNFERGGGFKREEFKYYTGNKARKEQQVKSGDLIIALTDMTSEAKVVGAPAIVSIPSNYNYGIISLDCAKALLIETVSNPYFLYLYLSVSQEENAMFANGVNVLHLNLEQFV
ncbi:MAG: restriction endonuclease subunit S, partial [Caldimicrobium sp.]